MSHLTCAKAIITDLDCIEEAVKKLPIPDDWKLVYHGFKAEFIRDQKTFKWFGNNTGACDHAIRLTFGRTTDDYVYEVGLVPLKEGGWSLQYDSGMCHMLGQDAEKLMSLYAEEVCNKYARDTGVMMEKQELEDGNLRIELIQV